MTSPKPAERLTDEQIRAMRDAYESGAIHDMASELLELRQLRGSIVTIDADAFDELEAAMSNPAQPNQLIENAAKLMRELYPVPPPQSSSFTQGYEQGRDDAAKVACDPEKTYGSSFGIDYLLAYLKGRQDAAASVRSLPIPQAPGENR